MQLRDTATYNKCSVRKRCDLNGYKFDKLDVMNKFMEIHK